MNTETIPNNLKEPIDVDKPKGPEDLLEQNKKTNRISTTSMS